VHLVNEEHAGHKLSNAVVDVFVDDFVDFESELFSNFGLLGSVDLAHKRKEVAAALRTRVCDIQVVQGDVLDNLLLFVNIALGNGHILFGLEVELGCVRVAAADSLDSAGCGLDVNDIADGNFLLLDVFVDRRVEFELLLTLGCLEGNND